MVINDLLILNCSSVSSYCPVLGDHYTDYFPDEESRLTGISLTNDLFEAALRRPIGSAPYYVVIDEVYKFLLDELGRALLELRKRGVFFFLSFHHPWQFKQYSEKLYRDVMAGANTKIVLRTLHCEDAAELVSDVCTGLGNPHLAYEQERLNHLVRDVMREVIAITESESHAETTSEEEAHSRQRSHTASLTEGDSITTTHSMQEGHLEGRGETEGENYLEGTSTNGAANRGKSIRPTEDGEEEVNHLSDTTGTSKNEQHGMQRGTSHIEQVSKVKGKALAIGVITQKGKAETEGETAGLSKGKGNTDGKTKGRSITVTNQPGTEHIPFLEKTRVDYSLDQWTRTITEQVMSFPDLHGLVKIGPEKERRLAVSLPPRFYVSEKEFAAYKDALGDADALPPETAKKQISARRLRLLTELTSQQSRKEEG